MGEQFKAKCRVTWCTNMLTAFDFAVGHNIPESKGGTLELGNLRPICNRCNTSMGANYTIDEWNRLSPTPPPCCCGLFACFSAAPVVPPDVLYGITGKTGKAEKTEKAEQFIAKK
jgi:hypothetical protein